MKKKQKPNVIDILISLQIYDGHVVPCDDLLWYASMCPHLPYWCVVILMPQMMALKGGVFGGD